MPCFHLIERAFPDRERLVLTNVPVASNAAPLEAVLKGGGFIHGSIAYPVGVRDPKALVTLAHQLRGLGIDTLVYLAASRGLRTAWRDLAYFRLCGFRHVIGIPLTRDLQNNRVDWQGVLERECHRLGRTLEELGHIDFNNREWWDLRLTAEERMSAASALQSMEGRPFLAVNTGGKALEKDWGEQNWSSLLHTLSERAQGYGLLFVGAREDVGRAEHCGAVWSSGPVVDVCGKLTPRESAAALERAHLFIGHDSGPMHLADAVGTPCIGLLGNYNRPKMWHPDGPQTQIIHHREGMAAITQEEVADAALPILGSKTIRAPTESNHPSSKER